MPSPSVPVERPPEPGPESLERDLERLEAKVEEALGELKSLKGRWRHAAERRERSMRRAWSDLDHRWFNLVLAGGTFLFILGFYIHSHLGWRHEQVPLPAGSDPVLDLLPVVDVVPVLTVGWLLFHVAALAVGVVYEPRRLPYFLSTIGLFVAVRSVFILLNPYGAPPGMLSINADALIAPLKGVLSFENEFFFSGHTSMPYLYFLFSHRMPRLRLAFLGTSFVMGACVLLTRNHYAMDVLGAYFMTYSIYRLSRYVLGWLDPVPDRTGAD